MTTPAIVALETTTLPAARRLLQEQQIRRLPVVNAGGALVGIITEGDINRISASPATDVRDYNLYHRVADLPLRDCMTREVITVTPETPIVTVAMILRDRKIGGVPVMDDGYVVGMITENDLFNLLICEYDQSNIAIMFGAG
ncbi:MAG: CBS domain-containing protein [Chloroflexi bacterium]|nr:CBS domain-containing protein [Chloroflexota bacterium]